MRLKFILTDDSGNVYDGELELEPKAGLKSQHKIAAIVRQPKDGQEDIGNNYKFPDWFYSSEPTVAHAVALLLHELKVSLSSGQIAKIISKAWKDIDLRNVSKVLTTRGKWLYVYVQKDNDGKYNLNDKGRTWVEKEVIPLYKPES